MRAIRETIIEAMESADLQPLQYLAAVRVAISVCESEDVQSMIRRFRKSNDNDGIVGFSDDQWIRLRGKAKRKLKQRGVPDLIIDIVLENLWPISFEISKWILFHVKDTGVDRSPNFCWTQLIRIDYEKTAEILTQNEAIDIKNRFKLVCVNCLEAEVRYLWDQMSLLEKRSFFVRGNLEKSDQNPIVLYWTYYIQEVPVDFWDSKALNHTQLLKYAVENGYFSATKFFIGQLKESFRNRMIANCLFIHLRKLYDPKNVVKDHMAIVYFLICHTRSRSREREITLFTSFCLVFLIFLEWPMQKHFMTVVNRLKHEICPRTFGRVLEGIFRKAIDGFKDHNYKELFKEFWLQSPVKHKTFVTGFGIGFNIFMKFVKKHFGFVFEYNSFGNDSSTLKKKFRATLFQQDISENGTFFEEENVEFFKFLVRQRLTHRQDIQRFLNRRTCNTTFEEYGNHFSDVPLEELMYLIDGISRIN